MENKFTIEVNKSSKFSLKESDLEQLDLLKLSKTHYHLIYNNKSISLKIINSNFNNKEYTIELNSNSYHIKIANQLDQLIEAMGFSTKNVKKENNIKAPMPGLIINVNVKEGQKVAEGETLLILEAMKMENAICAPKDGIINKITVTKGGIVEKGELMIEII